jgi:hypothetical protein
MSTQQIKLAIAAARKGMTADGRITVEYPDVRDAASAMGQRLDLSPMQLGAVLSLAGAVESATGPRGKRHAFDSDVLAQYLNGVPGINHLGGEGIAVRVTASENIPCGWDVSEFNPYLPQCYSTQLSTISCSVREGDADIYTQAAWVTLHLKKDAPVIGALKFIRPSVHNLRAVASLDRTPTQDRIDLGVTYADRRIVEFNAGALIWKQQTAEDYQFTFIFTDVKAR